VTLLALEEDAMEKMEIWTLFAPLGELPNEGALEEMAKSLQEEERRHRSRTLPLAAQEPVEWLKRFMEEVRGSEGILTSQVDGGGVAWRRAKFYGPAATSVLAAAAVHAERSAYVLIYKKEGVWGSYKAPHSNGGIHGLPHAETVLIGRYNDVATGGRAWTRPRRSKMPSKRQRNAEKGRGLSSFS
jgi:hypothetical protein